MAMHGPAPFWPSLNERSRRLAIADLYVNLLEAPPPCKWFGEDGTISVIMGERGLRLPAGCRCKVRRVLERVMQCIEDGEQYTGDLEAAGSG